MPAELAAPTAPPALGPATLPAALAGNRTGSPGPPTVARTRGPATHPAHGDEEEDGTGGEGEAGRHEQRRRKPTGATAGSARRRLGGRGRTGRRDAARRRSAGGDEREVAEVRDDGEERRAQPGRRRLEWLPGGPVEALDRRVEHVLRTTHDEADLRGCRRGDRATVLGRDGDAIDVPGDVAVGGGAP